MEEEEEGPNALAGAVTTSRIEVTKNAAAEGHLRCCRTILMVREREDGNGSTTGLFLACIFCEHKATQKRSQESMVPTMGIGTQLQLPASAAAATFFVSEGDCSEEFVSLVL